MQLYFAPMEGLTDRIYRNLHHKYFPGVDRYYMPFFSPTTEDKLSPREQRELPPASDDPFYAVPQLLTRDADAFLRAARLVGELGYDQVNLNAGCPSGTVVSKGKGSGLLRDLDALDAFLERIFRSSPLPISIKTRIGLEDLGQWEEILRVYNRYPLRELIVHPRLRQEFYTGGVHMDAFRLAEAQSAAPLCYNGDLFTLSRVREFSEGHPALPALMLGRGLIGNPGMLTPGGTRRETLEQFHGELLQTYTEVFGSSRNAMFRMKENWSYLIHLFGNSGKLGKCLKKVTDIDRYKSITAEIFATLPLLPEMAEFP